MIMNLDVLSYPDEYNPNPLMGQDPPVKLILKVKTIVGYSEKALDKKVNDFLSDTSLEIIEVQYSSNLFFHSVLILYK